MTNKRIRAGHNVPIVIRDKDGNLIDTEHPLPVEEVARTDSPQEFEDTNFVSGNSPALLDCNAALGRNATEFTVINDGAGDFLTATSNNGVSFSDDHTTKNGETYALDDISVHTIRITHITDSAYRVTVL